MIYAAAQSFAAFFFSRFKISAATFAANTGTAGLEPLLG
jgi:hypothetical protein